MEVNCVYVRVGGRRGRRGGGRGKQLHESCNTSHLGFMLYTLILPVPSACSTGVEMRERVSDWEERRWGWGEEGDMKQGLLSDSQGVVVCQHTSSLK